MGLYNCYGITETSIFSTCRRVTQADAIEASRGSFPYSSLIGKPLVNSTFYVLNSHGQLLPPGVTGELYIGSQAVAEGYVQRPELTSDRFKSLPATGERVFKTGDLVRYVPELDDFDFLGRVDQQLKVRGYRVEPFEIEQALQAHPAIKQAVAVMLKKPPMLAAFFTLADGVSEAPASKQLMLHMQSEIPSYMVPQRFIHLPSIPTTSNRKIDRKSLSLWNPRNRGSRCCCLVPRSEFYWSAATRCACHN